MPIQRRSPLRPGTGSRKRSLIRKVNRARKARLFHEDFGGKEYLAFIHGLECAVCGMPCDLTEAAHLTSRGAGGKADVLVPLCGTRFGVLGCHARFDAHDPEIRKHEPRLRPLAKRLRAEFLLQTESNDDAA